MFWIFEVKGAAIEASASERDKPTSAVLSALQSLAPSPHIATIISLFSFWISVTSIALWSGDILANTLACFIILVYASEGTPLRDKGSFITYSKAFPVTHSS